MTTLRVHVVRPAAGPALEADTPVREFTGEDWFDQLDEMVHACAERVQVGQSHAPASTPIVSVSLTADPLELERPAFHLTARTIAALAAANADFKFEPDV